MTLPFYLALQYIRMLIGIGIFIMALIYIVDVIDRFQIHASDENSAAQIALYTSLRLPGLYIQFLPLVILLGSMFTFLRLARNSELVILRAAGIPAMRTVFVPLFITTIIGLLCITLLNPFFVGAHNLSGEFEDRLRGRPNEIMRMADGGLWLRENGGEETRIIHLTRVLWNKKTFKDAEFFIKSKNGEAIQVVAPKAMIEDGKWILKKAIIIDENGQSHEAQGDLTYPTNRSFESFHEILATPDSITNMELRNHIKELEQDGYDTKDARAYFYAQLALPIFYMALCLIGAVFALAPMRGGGTSIRVLLALGSGFTLYALTKLAEALGQAGTLPFFISSFAIPLGALFFALALLLHHEDG